MTMKAMVLEQVASMDDISFPLRLIDVPVPRPEPNELLVRVSACGVCHTEYAQYMTVPAEYAVPIPDSLDDAKAAPLLCAGAIGYRSLRLTGVADGEPLGLMGFGGSAHLVLQLVKFLYAKSPVFVFTRDRQVQEFALKIGADWAGDISQCPPQPLQAIIDTTPAWRPVVESMKKLQPGGRLVINAIRKQDDDKLSLQELSYHDHLWMEREIKSVANLTRFDIAEFLSLAAQIPIRSEVTVYPLEQANEALGTVIARYSFPYCDDVPLSFFSSVLCSAWTTKRLPES